jgi:hypothetical protein
MLNTQPFEIKLTICEEKWKNKDPKKKIAAEITSMA